MELLADIVKQGAAGSVRTWRDVVWYDLVWSGAVWQDEARQGRYDKPKNPTSSPRP